MFREIVRVLQSATRRARATPPQRGPQRRKTRHAAPQDAPARDTQRRKTRQLSRRASFRGAPAFKARTRHRRDAAAPRDRHTQKNGAQPRSPPAPARTRTRTKPSRRQRATNAPPTCRRRATTRHHRATNAPPSQRRKRPMQPTTPARTCGCTVPNNAHRAPQATPHRSANKRHRASRRSAHKSFGKRCDELSRVLLRDDRDIFVQRQAIIMIL